MRCRALGERESGTARLEEAVAAYRAALEERTRERVPLDWAATQNNLGNALSDARRARERHGAAGGGGRRPIARRWRKGPASACRSTGRMTQNNLGNALSTLGERESGTARLEEAVDGLSRGAGGMDPRARAARLGDDAEQSRQCAFGHSGSARAARRGWRRRWPPIARRWRNRTRERVPLDWATTQNNLGIALSTLGERESGTARLEEAVTAYRAALEEWTRERVPLDWAATQNNLGIALSTLGAARERHGAAGGGGDRLSRGAGGMDPRARAARLGRDAEQSRQCAVRRSGSARAARRGWRRR